MLDGADVVVGGIGKIEGGGFGLVVLDGQVRLSEGGAGCGHKGEKREGLTDTLH
jgi:hypothetical protein